MSEKPKIIAIVGPTASGKTTLGIALARRFGGEIVSADSRQIYRGMDIGTAKPTAAERAAVPHHLIDIREPGEEYTVADYQRNAAAALTGIAARGRVPFLVGGTGLYINAIIENLDIPKVTADPALRAEIEAMIARDGLAAAFKKLIALDPDAEAAVDAQNPRRVVRALEVALATGEPFTAQRRAREPLFKTLTLRLDPPTDILRERIDRRVDAMIADGFENEVRRLLERYGPETPAFNAIGYREMIGCIAGHGALADAVAAIKMNTWHYAKRQTTWFKKYASGHTVSDEAHAAALIENFITIKKALSE